MTSGLFGDISIALPTGWLPPPIGFCPCAQHRPRDCRVDALRLSLRIEIPEPRIRPHHGGSIRLRLRWRRPTTDWCAAKARPDCRCVSQPSHQKRSITHFGRCVRQPADIVGDTPERVVSHEQHALDGAPPLGEFRLRDTRIVDRNQDVCAPIIDSPVGSAPDGDGGFRPRRPLDEVRQAFGRQGRSPVRGKWQVAGGGCGGLPLPALLPHHRVILVARQIWNGTRFPPGHLRH